MNTRLLMIVGGFMPYSFVRRNYRQWMFGSRTHWIRSGDVYFVETSKYRELNKRKPDNDAQACNDEKKVSLEPQLKTASTDSMIDAHVAKNPYNSRYIRSQGGKILFHVTDFFYLNGSYLSSEKIFCIQTELRNKPNPSKFSSYFFSHCYQ